MFNSVLFTSPKSFIIKTSGSFINTFEGFVLSSTFVKYILRNSLGIVTLNINLTLGVLINFFSIVLVFNIYFFAYNIVIVVSLCVNISVIICSISLVDFLNNTVPPLVIIYLLFIIYTTKNFIKVSTTLLLIFLFPPS